MMDCKIDRFEDEAQSSTNVVAIVNDLTNLP